MSAPRARRSHAPDSAQQHRDWLHLVEVSGPFLSLPVLRATWPNLDASDKPTRETLRVQHTMWQDDTAAGQYAWVNYVLADLLGWSDALCRDELDALVIEVAEHDTRLVPDFALVEPGEDVKPATTRILGMLCSPGVHPTNRISGEAWAATPADRMARLCRHHEVELGLVTDGRWWTLVRAPRGKVTTTATFDAIAWPESAERDVLRAFVSMLCRKRFFGVPAEETLPALLRSSEDSQEEITEELGKNVRQAVELLVAAIGRADTTLRQRGEAGLAHVEAHEVYRCAVTVMMRIVFVLFAEERRLLPADNELYAEAYSAGRLYEALQERVNKGSESDLEYSSQQWNRLLALFDAVYSGIDHPRLHMPAHGGSLFDPERFDWLPRIIDDRTVLHMLRAVQFVEIGTGRSKERRQLSFRELDVEQIGYVYEGLLSYDGFRADEVVVSLIGKPGLEKEIGLRELEGLAAGCADLAELASAVAEEYKDYKIGSPRAVQKALAPLSGADRENARRKLLGVTLGDARLTDRLEPFYGVIRQDLRELPVVIMPGELFVTDSPLRKNTGTHYTPRDLAEQIVDGALEPLVWQPGPLQTADSTQWKPRSSTEILALNVADIAMGSAAFLVAAARYLGDKLLEAWIREDDERVRDYRHGEPGGDTDVDPIVVDARREIIQHCLYGVDINEMAVEMAKLSLWLVSMDPHRPFTFLDDRLVAGDSLLGITSLEQIESMHMDPKKGRDIHERSLVDFTAGVRELVSEVAADRRAIAEIDDSTLDGLERKRDKLAKTAYKTKFAWLFADLAVGAALAHAGRGDRGMRVASIAAADQARRIKIAEQDARDTVRKWLDSDLPNGNLPRQTLHWPLIFPEVFAAGGFDAIIGNPPFCGGKKISGSHGSSYREHLAIAIAEGAKGNADLIVYFLLRANSILSPKGQFGLIGTSVLAHGQNRQVGLDQLQRDGVSIMRSISAKVWPAKSASLEYCYVCGTKEVPSKDALRICDGDRTASFITTSLKAATGPKIDAYKLKENNHIHASQGSILLGRGFVLPANRAHELISKNSRNSMILKPLMGGEELNVSPTVEADKWVIDFGDMSELLARSWSDVWRIIELKVKPERSEKDANKYPKMVYEWWKHWNRRRELYQKIDKIVRVIALTRLSHTQVPTFTSSRQVFNDQVVVFCTQDAGILAILSSAHHYVWIVDRAAPRGVGAAPRYAPTDIFETFPLPGLSGELRELGDRLDTFRRDVMLSRSSGLTKTYNLVFDPNCGDEDIEELRRIHRAIDEATIRAYGWQERIERVGGLDHGFHHVGRETRYTIGPAAQREILDSLLELNHQRHAEEVAQGLHDKKGKKTYKSNSSDEGALF